MAHHLTTDLDQEITSASGHLNNDADSYINSPIPESITSPIVPPPYWQDEETEAAALIFSNRSRASSKAAGQIKLVDNTTSDASASDVLACWARSARIDDWTVIEAGALGSIVGSYVVFNCMIETTNGSTFKINKRYSEFDTLHANLVTTFPNSRSAIPPVPPKSAFYKFQTKFLNKRKDGLEYFLHNVICNPEFAASPILKDFLFA